METDEKNAQSEIYSLPNTASLLASLSVSLELQALTLPAFLALLEQMSQQPFTQERADITETLTRNLCRVIKQTVETSEGVALVHETVVSRTLLLCIAPSLKSLPAPTRHVFMEDAVLRQCLSLFKTFTVAANSDHRCVNVCMCACVHACKLYCSTAYLSLGHHSFIRYFLRIGFLNFQASHHFYPWMYVLLNEMLLCVYFMHTHSLHVQLSRHNWSVSSLVLSEQ